MTFILISGMVLSGWAMLSVLSGERLRRMNDLEAERAATRRAAEIAANPPAEPAKRK